MNDLPDGMNTWPQYIRVELGVGALCDEQHTIDRICRCDALPLGRQELKNYAGPLSVDGESPAPLLHISTSVLIQYPFSQSSVLLIGSRREVWMSGLETLGIRLTKRLQAV